MVSKSKERNAAHRLEECAEIFKDRHRIYGDNYKTVGRVMDAFFKDGLSIASPDDWNRLHIFVLIVVKLTRYVENWQAGGHEDSLTDAAVYAAMLAEIDEEINTRKEVDRRLLDADLSDQLSVTLDVK